MRKGTSVREREKDHHKVVIQRGTRNDRNPYAPAHKILHQQWTQHCEEQARVAAWELHTHVYKNPGDVRFFKTKTVTGAISLTGISREKGEFTADSGASVHMTSKSDLVREERRNNSEIERVLYDYHSDQTGRQKKGLCTSKVRTC